jgi:hypothetical protein
MRSVDSNCVVLLSLALLCFAEPAQAWCQHNAYEDEDGDGDFDPPLPFANVLAFEVEDSPVEWDAMIGFLDFDGHAYDDFRDVLEHVVDATSQSWNREARSPVKLGFGGFVAGVGVDVTDGVSTISVGPCVGSTAGTFEDITNRNSCDIQFCRAEVANQTCMEDADCTAFGGQCSNGVCQTTLTRLDSSADADGSGAGIYRLLRHEMGHCLGVGHACNGASCSNANSEQVCYAEPVVNSSQPMRSDLPHGEDIEALQEILRGDTLAGADRLGIFASPNSLLPRREIVLRSVVQSTTQVWSTTAAQPLGLYSVYLPRLDCRRGTGAAVDCVMVRAWTEKDLRVNPISAAAGGGSPVLGATTTVAGVVTRRAPDVALSHNATIENIAIAVVAPSTPSDDLSCSVNQDCPLSYTCSTGICRKPCTAGCRADETCGGQFCAAVYNRQRPIVVHKFTNLNATAVHTQKVLSDEPNGVEAISAHGPRISYVRSFGNACVSGAGCLNGFASTQGRWLVATTALDRTPQFFLSDVTGTNWRLMEEDPPETSTTEMNARRIIEGFDLACANHVLGATAVQDRLCYFLFDQYDVPGQGPGEVDEQNMTATGKHTLCTIRVAFSPVVDRYRLVECTAVTADVGSDPAYLASLSDYGSNIGTGQRSGRKLIISNALQSPHLQQANENSALRLFSHAGGLVAASDQDGPTLRYSIDSVVGGCDPMTATDRAMSYFGGAAAEYCEDCGAILMPVWGEHGAVDVPGATCF